MDRRAVEQYRLALFGRFIMGVAHEVDNHLSVVLGFAELIQISGGAEKKAVDGAAKILVAGERINAIVKQFSRHVRPHEPVRERFVAADVLKEILQFARYDICRGNVALAVPDDMPRDLLTGDPRDFGLAALALLVNGTEAMAGRGGTLTVAAGRRGDAWEFIVSDEGPGIPPDVHPRIFEEGFGTKREPYNTGMGLPVARHIASGMEGTVVVACRPQGGCDATLTIPAR